MSVAVVDDSGRLLSVIRFDGAGYATADVARRKAETAAMNRMPSGNAETLSVDFGFAICGQDYLGLHRSFTFSIQGSRSGG